MRKPAPSAEYYDDLYLTDDRTYERPRSSRYYPLYRKVSDLVVQAGVRSVLEVGCGSGVLASMLIEAGIVYSGFDFNRIAVQKARALNSEGTFFVADAADHTTYARAYESIVCCEVLEHIEADLEVMSLWKRGTKFICSVPNFDYESHVRYFHSESEIRQRYRDLLDIDRIERVTSSARAGTAWPEYLRRLRWARNQPTRMLGMLGLNTFSWYGGWFVFAGRRR